MQRYGPYLYVDPDKANPRLGRPPGGGVSFYAARSNHRIDNEHCECSECHAYYLGGHFIHAGSEPPHPEKTLYKK